jgi:hypothetical protein
MHFHPDDPRMPVFSMDELSRMEDPGVISREIRRGKDCPLCNLKMVPWEDPPHWVWFCEPCGFRSFLG